MSVLCMSSFEEQLAEQKKQCPFCKIISGEIPAKKVYEDDVVVCILDINPASDGHVLILPKEHMPVYSLLSQDTQDHLAKLLPQFIKHLKEAMLARYVYAYIASGAAAHQQSAHSMIHLIPSDKPLEQFSPPTTEVSVQGVSELVRVLSHNVPQMLGDKAQQYAIPDPKQRLSELLAENPDFKQTLIDNPAAIKQGISENPSLQDLFEGVDIDQLSLQLHPKAHTLSDDELVEFVSRKERLKEYLLSDPSALEAILDSQPRLKHFFSEQTPTQVASRLEGKL